MFYSIIYPIELWDTLICYCNYLPFVHELMRKFSCRWSYLTLVCFSIWRKWLWIYCRCTIKTLKFSTNCDFFFFVYYKSNNDWWWHCLHTEWRCLLPNFTITTISIFCPWYMISGFCNKSFCWFLLWFEIFIKFLRENV